MAEPIWLHDRVSEKSARPICILSTKAARWPCRIGRLSAAGAFVETMARPTLGSPLVLVHPVIGGIAGTVAGHALNGVSLSFELTEESSAFALAVTANDMTISPPAPVRACE